MNDPITDRIKKLLRLSRSANRHESELALQRAFELAERHRIDVASIDLDEESHRIVHEWFSAGMRLDALKKGALNVVCNYFHVSVCVSRPRVLFVGKATDVQIAHYVFEFLVTAGRRAVRDWQSVEIKARRKATSGKRNNFIQGFIYGIAEKLNEVQKRPALHIDDSLRALIIAERTARDHVLSSIIGSTKPLASQKVRRNESALIAGYRKGLETRINQPLRTGGETLQLL